MADKDGVDLPDDFNQLLRQELSIEPSPAFAARIRERVAQPHRSPWWRARWIPALGYVATAASITAALIVPAIARWAAPPVPPAAPVLRLPSLPHAPRGVVLPSEAPVIALNVSRRRPAVLRVTHDMPEVIVDGRQRAALTALFRMMDEGRVSGDSFAATIPVSNDPIVEQMGAIIVAPVVVSAMPPGGVLHNDNER